MTASDPRPFSKRLTLIICGVGGQALPFVVRQLLGRLSNIATSIVVEETHGMAQRGGSVTARVHVAFASAMQVSPQRVLLGLERIEGARALDQLREGDVAFIATGCLLPPGPASIGAPADEELETFAAERGIALSLVEAAPASPWAVVQEAFERGAIPQ